MDWTIIAKAAWNIYKEQQEKDEGLKEIAGLLRANNALLVEQLQEVFAKELDKQMLEEAENLLASYHEATAEAIARKDKEQLDDLQVNVLDVLSTFRDKDLLPGSAVDYSLAVSLRLSIFKELHKLKHPRHPEATPPTWKEEGLEYAKKQSEWITTEILPSMRENINARFSDCQEQFITREPGEHSEPECEINWFYSKDNQRTMKDFKGSLLGAKCKAKSLDLKRQIVSIRDHDIKSTLEQSPITKLEDAVSIWLQWSSFE